MHLTVSVISTMDTTVKLELLQPNPERGSEWAVPERGQSDALNLIPFLGMYLWAPRSVPLSVDMLFMNKTANQAATTEKQMPHSLTFCTHTHTNTHTRICGPATPSYKFWLWPEVEWVGEQPHCCITDLCRRDSATFTRNHNVKLWSEWNQPWQKP